MVGVQADTSPSAGGLCVRVTPRKMEEPGYCNLSLAVDCTLSLGSTTSRIDIPARLSRAGSPDQDHPWPLTVLSERVERDRSEQDMSWGGSSNRSDPDISPEYFPQVSERGRITDFGRKDFKAWPRSSSQSYKDEANASKSLFSTLEDQAYSNRSSRQPWLPNYFASRVTVEAKAASRIEQEGDGTARVCAHCGTSKTPLWRNGPGGPKSLCNACGIRFKKAGRRSAASGCSESQTSPPVTTKVGRRRPANDDQQYWMFPPEVKSRKRSRGPLVRTSDSLLSGSCMTWQSSLFATSPKSTLQQDFRASPVSRSQVKELNLQMGSFSSDEEEGAVLLMALSCGMVNA
ncbi:uncharacterized protein [Physcomitrium patens]|uniref:GATA-type domain-containing protein n=1 Tax=Physcomitrium patens TaxID=3218 RepID=A0A2K1J152_PHYPA|nr:GATA-type zinc finger protein 1-like [Physcomitrium patens]PNR35253.1 hypothetical protein PHYPA_023152 [Physcomitrium patens]|eukprot:XP_024403006.1 GATA-type zinc finger protein 1-like [Physcomitrella patens]